MKHDEVEIVQVELDEELMQKLADRICQGIEEVVQAQSEQDKDPRIEIFTLLLWIAAGVAQELGVEKSSFLEIAEDSFESNNDLPTILN